jgi:hypothetical protein
MPGFVDVSNMSSEDVRRMGHADDYDDVDYQPRRKFNSYPARSVSAKYTVSDVWAAACAAHRVNGGYHKEYVYEWNEAEGRNNIVMRKNRDVMMEFLADPTQLTVDDVERGEHCRQFLQNDLTFRTLKNKIGEFDTALKKVLAVQDQFDSYHHKYELAIVACLPQSVERSELRQASESRVQFAQGGLVGEVGDKIDANIEVLNSQYSKQYNVYWVRGITEADQAVFFSSKESYDAGTHLSIKGTVKAHRDNLTQLNRVKVL